MCENYHVYSQPCVDDTYCQPTTSLFCQTQGFVCNNYLSLRLTLYLLISFKV